MSNKYTQTSRLNQSFENSVSDSAGPRLIYFNLSKWLHISASCLQYNELLHAVADPKL